MRKLACAALSFAGAAAAAHYLLPGGALLWCAGGAGFAPAFPRRCCCGKPARLRSLIICIFAARACAVLAYTAIYVEPAAGLAGSELSVTARVLDYPVRDEGYASVELRIEQEGLAARQDRGIRLRGPDARS